MPTFSYRAYNRGGSPVAGTINAAGPREAVQELKNTGLYPTEVKQARAEGSWGHRVKATELAAFTRQLATLLASGTNLSESLSVLADTASTQKLRAVIQSLKESISGGSSFAKALEEHPDIFTPLFRGLIVSAEASGSLDTVLPRLADYLEKRARIAAEVKAALTYPALMTIVGITVLGFLFIFVIPKIARIFEETGTPLPFITVVLLWTTGMAAKYWHILLAGTAGAVWIAARELKRGRGMEYIDRLALKLPWFGPIVMSFQVATMTRTLGSLLKGGVQLLTALELTKEVTGSLVFKNMLSSAVQDCAGGTPLSMSLRNSSVLPPFAVHMISVGERSGALDEMLLKAADSYDSEFENGIKKSLNLLEPSLILIMGVVVGFIVLAMLLPIFELNQVIR